MILLGLSPLSFAKPAISLAAAITMPSVIVLARTSSAPLKMPGNRMLLFTWFGKSDRPVATISAPAAIASLGHISGTGFARRKTIALLAIPAISRFLTTRGPGAAAATRTSAPFNASSSPPVTLPPFVSSATSYFHLFLNVRNPDRKRVGVYPSEIFVDERLSLHDREGGLRPNLSEAQDPTPVRDNRDAVPAIRVFEGEFHISLDQLRHRRHPRGVPDREVVEGADRYLRHRRNLASVKRGVPHRLP